MTIDQATADGAARYAQEAAGYRPLLFSAAYQMTHNPADAEDLVQETYLKAHQHCASFQGTYLRGWLSRILTNTFINAYHSRQRRPEVLGLDGDEARRGAAPRRPGPGATRPRRCSTACLMRNCRPCSSRCRQRACGWSCSPTLRATPIRR